MGLRNNSGNLAILAAIRRASSWLSSLAVIHSLSPELVSVGRGTAYFA